MQLKIKNFGPIKKGYTNPQTDDFFDVHRCSVLIGEQGTGKSTIAKLISTLLWLEKDIIQRRRDFNQFKTEDFIKLCKNQKIDGYFKLEYKSFSSTHKGSSFLICCSVISSSYKKSSSLDITHCNRVFCSSVMIIIG